MQIGNALDSLCPLLALRNPRQQQRGENADDGDDHQEFNQRETPSMKWSDVPATEPRLGSASFRFQLSQHLVQQSFGLLHFSDAHEFRKRLHFLGNR